MSMGCEGLFRFFKRVNSKFMNFNIAIKFLYSLFSENSNLRLKYLLKLDQIQMVEALELCDKLLHIKGCCETYQFKGL